MGKHTRATVQRAGLDSTTHKYNPAVTLVIRIAYSVNLLALRNTQYAPSPAGNARLLPASLAVPLRRRPVSIPSQMGSSFGRTNPESRIENQEPLSLYPAEIGALSRPAIRCPPYLARNA